MPGCMETRTKEGVFEDVRETCVSAKLRLPCAGKRHPALYVLCVNDLSLSAGVDDALWLLTFLRG